jgi:PIN domain nuclease of toxin-antitoxin system
MRALLDTHAFLWWTTDDPRVSRHVRELLRDPTNTFFFSAASAWELIIKAQQGKLKLPVHAAPFIREQLVLNAFLTLPIDLAHALHLHILPMHHQDPFDRILIAQSQVEKLPIVTADPLIAQYQVEAIW